MRTASSGGSHIHMCVCLLLQDLVQRCLHGGGGGYGRTCATRDDEPRPVWTSLPITHGWGPGVKRRRSLYEGLQDLVCVCLKDCRT
jgi:hypothetical protein